jgi:MFS family permease
MVIQVSADQARGRDRARSSNFRLFLVNQVASQLGTWLQFVAVAWLVSEQAGTGAALGWIAVLTFGPLLVLGPWMGALADRVDKHYLLIVTQVLMVIQAATLGVLLLMDHAGISAIYGLTLIYGLIHAAEAPVRRAFVAELVDQQYIPRAVSLSNVIAALGRVLGPLCASALITTVGIGWCFVATAVSYLVAVAVLKSIVRSALCPADAITQPGTVRAGFHYAWKSPELRIALILTGAVAMFGFNHQVLVPLLATRTFHGGAGEYTMLYCAISLGSVLGAVAVARREYISPRFLIWATFSFAFTNAVLAVAPNVWLGLVGCFATGATALVFITASVALLQQRCAPDMRGRVMAFYAMVLLGGVPIGAPIVGALADFAGPRAAVAVGSVVAVVAAGFALRQLSYARGSRDFPVVGDGDRE